MKAENLVILVVQGLVCLNRRHAGDGASVQNIQASTRNENSVDGMNSRYTVDSRPSLPYTESASECRDAKRRKEKKGSAQRKGEETHASLAFALGRFELGGGIVTLAFLFAMLPDIG